MSNPNFAQAFVNQFIQSLPPGLGKISQALERHLQQCLQQWFEKLNLVTREEFDIQAKVLAKTREKVEKLEAALKS